MSDQVTNFESILQTHNDKMVFVIFYMPSCPACKMSLPVFRYIADKCKNKDNCVFVQVSSTTAQDLFDKFKVSVVPTFMIFNKMEVVNRKEGSGPETLTELAAVAGVDLDKNNLQDIRALISNPRKMLEIY